MQGGGVAALPTCVGYWLMVCPNVVSGPERLRRLGDSAETSWVWCFRDIASMARYGHLSKACFKHFKHKQTQDNMGAIVPATRDVPKRYLKRRTIRVVLTHAPVLVALMATLEQPLLGLPWSLEEGADESARAQRGKHLGLDALVEAHPCPDRPMVWHDFSEGCLE